MSKKNAKGKKTRPLPKPSQQIPNSLVRKSAGVAPNQELLHARDYPIYGCWAMAGWQESGMTPVIVARQPAPDRIMFGNYMVDLYCLGVKDVFTRWDYSLKRFERDLPDMLNGAPQKISVELAHEIIFGALEYAEKLGFEPHPDFKRQMAGLLLDPPEAHPRKNHVKFGKDGKPLYISGPYDDEWKVRSVLSTLQRTCGKGNFDYLIGLDQI